jgi:hypothetical protein
VPKGKTVDEYLAELESRWIRVLDKNARKNLLDDVQSLLRANLRRALQIYRQKRLTRENLKDMTMLLITSNPTLKDLKDQEPLRLYMELYMLKLLSDRRFVNAN